MRKKMCLMFLVLLLGTGGLFAQRLCIQTNFVNGTNEAFAFSDWSKITFANGNVNVEVASDGIHQYTFANFSSWTFVNRFPTGIETVVKTKTGLKCYPNPVETVLNIESETALGIVSVYNMSGSMVKSFRTSGNQFVVDMSGLSKGVYFIKAEGKVSKILKK